MKGTHLPHHQQLNSDFNTSMPLKKINQSRRRRGSTKQQNEDMFSLPLTLMNDPDGLMLLAEGEDS